MGIKSGVENKSLEVPGDSFGGRKITDDLLQQFLNSFTSFGRNQERLLCNAQELFDLSGGSGHIGERSVDLVHDRNDL